MKLPQDILANLKDLRDLVQKAIAKAGNIQSEIESTMERMGEDEDSTDLSAANEMLNEIMSSFDSADDNLLILTVE